MFAAGETGKTKAQAIPYDWSSGIYVSSEAGVGKWYVVNLRDNMDPAGPFDATGRTSDGKTDINITIKNPLAISADINCIAYIGDNETSRHFTMAAGGSKSMTFGAGMFVRMGINEVYLYLVTDVTVTEQEAQEQHQAVNVDVKPVEANSVSFEWVDYDWDNGNTIAANKETWIKINMENKVLNTETFRITVTNNGNAATTIYGGFATDCPATNIQEQNKDIAANGQIVKVLDRAMLDMIPSVIYLRLKAGQQIHVWAEAVGLPATLPVLFDADGATQISQKNHDYATKTADPVRPDSIVYWVDYATLTPSAALGDNAKYYSVQMEITNNSGSDVVLTGKVAKNADLLTNGEVKSAVTRTYTVPAGKTIKKKLDKTLLSNIQSSDKVYGLILGGNSDITFKLVDVCTEENPCVPAEAIDMTIPAAGSSVIKNQAAGTKWYAVDVTAAKSAQADIQLTMTAAEPVDLTVDIAAVCAIGEPTQSYTGSSASTTKTLSYSLFKSAGNVVYVRVNTNKAITVKAEIIDLVKYTSTGWSQTPTADKAARIEADLEISNKLEVLGITLAGGNIHILNGGKLIVGAEGIKGSNAVDQIIVEDGGVLLIKDATSNNQPFVTAKKTLHFGAAESGARRPEKHEFIALPIDNREAMAHVRYYGWAYNAGWIVDGFNKAFTGYDVYQTSDATDYYQTFETEFKGQLASNKNQTLSLPGAGWHAFGNSWLDSIAVSKVLANVGAAEEQVHVYVATPAEFKNIHYGSENDEKLYLPLTAAIAAELDMKKIAPMQGFFLYTTSATTATLKFSDLDAFATPASPAPKRAASNNNRNAAAAVVCGGNQSDFVYMIEDEDANAHKMASNGLAIYAEDGLTQVANTNLIGTTLTLQTNEATEYTLSFVWLKGETLYLKDLENGNIIAMTADSHYTFTAEPNTVSERFQVVGRNNMPTDIENTFIEGVNKRIENGKVVIIKNGVKYNVLGTQL